MGNQAALSGLSRVPQGCLFGAGMAVTVCKGISTDGCMALSDTSKKFLIKYCTLAADSMLSRAFSFSILGGEVFV